MDEQSGGERTRTVWIDEKNGRRPWPARRVLLLVALPLMGLLTALATPWAVGHIENRLETEAQADLAAAGIDTSGLDIDFDYRDGTATGRLPTGTDAAQVSAAVDASLIRSFDVHGDAVESRVGTTTITWSQRSGKITITGEVETDSAKAALLDTAAEQVGRAAVVDEIVVSGATAPGDGPGRISSLLAVASAAASDDDLTAELTDTSLRVIASVGEPTTAATIESAASSSGLDDDTDVVIRSTEPTAADGAVDDENQDGSPIAVIASLANRVITLTGTVTTGEQRTRLADAAAGSADVVVNQIDIAAEGTTSADAEQRIAAVDAALRRLRGADSATVILRGADLAVTAAGPADMLTDLSTLDAEFDDVTVTVEIEGADAGAGLDEGVTADVTGLQSELDGLAAEIRDTVVFASGSAVLTENATVTLDRVVDAMNRFPLPAVEIAGHTDNVGNADANRRLSADRAEAVVAYLIGAGIAPDRLSSRGVGPDEPIAANDTAAGRAQNRRVELTAGAPINTP